MDLQLKDRIALVTGASAGIGRGIAETLAAEGCQLVLVARREEKLRSLASALVAEGAPEPTVIAQDLKQAGAIDNVFDAVSRIHGRLDVLVNNAGGSRPLEDLGTEEEWHEGMMFNFELARALTHAFVPLMRQQQFGRIINITGDAEPPGLNAAMPPNGATHIWAKGLSRVVGADGITVNCIPPGRIHAEQIDDRLLPTAEAQAEWVRQNCPVGYIGEPTDLAVLVAFLASPKARYITGQVIHADGGASRYAH